MFYIKDSKGKKSFSTTMFFIVFNVGLLKFLLSSLEIAGFKFETFSASDFSVLIASAGSIYSVQRYTDKKTKEEKDEESES